MKKLVLVLLLSLSQGIFAYESDQHTVPDQELADVGTDMSAFIYKQVNVAIAKINTDIKELPLKIESLEKQIIREENTKKLEFLKDEIAGNKARLNLIKSKMGITLSIYNEIGGRFSWEDQRDGVFGLPLSMIPYPKNVKDNKQITYVPSKFKNIYAYAGFHRIISSSYFVFCSSVKMFGVYMGVDKLGHMFNQGYEYFERYHKELNKTQDKTKAMSTVIDWGKSTENGMYGAIVDGVYSNGDLAANFAGFHFYENLLHPITLDEKTYPPVLIIKEDHTVEFNAENAIDEKELIALFFSNHLNEALNPSHYELLQRKVVKVAVKNRCEKVKRFYELDTASQAEALTESLFSWHGMDYGHRSDDLLRLDTLCF
ncbi:hypothetical protein SHI21_08145 [Bacteriovorax sp. PP10]|uniref:Uncharacterized protein n=1 Tax=Bacteriovorax antarcticus TaxID=3088717 RepID=A0ABU5VUU2_9BACT|nr:hypothetical protein [Bacteriovorax sp. PP10]MEA9356168.1 hypothetical protein [Bacteriovorax sp. PP10]